MNNSDAPATKKDLADLEKKLLAAIQEGDARLKDATKQDLDDLKEELLTAIREANSQLKVELKEELLEAMHDIETHLLKAFYGYTEIRKGI